MPALLLLLLPEADRDLASVHLGGQVIVSPDHLARIDQVRVPLGRHALALVRGPTGLVDRSVKEGLGPLFLGGRVGRRGRLGGETRLLQRSPFESGSGPDPTEVGGVTGLDDVVGHDAGVLRGVSKRA